MLSKWELCEATPSPDRSATALRSTSPTRGEVKIPPRSTGDTPPPAGRPCVIGVARSDRRVPGNRNLAISRSGLLDIGQRRKRIVKALDRHLFGDQHVVHFAARLLGLCTILIERGAPARIACEQGRMVGHVGLD